MKKIIGILISVSMIFSVGVPTFAESNMGLFAASAEETEPIGTEDQIHYIDDLSLELSYDDRYDLSDLDEGISPDEEYVIYKTEYAEGQGVTSCQVSQGKDTGEADEALLTMKAEEDVDNAETGKLTEAIATGVGSGTIWLVRADQEEDLRRILEGGEDPDSGNPDSGNPDSGNPDGEDPDGEDPDETIDVYEIAVTVEPAVLTLMFLAGQSNMEGYCDSYTGYDMGASIACEEGKVYSTYVPWGASKGKEITGIDFEEVCTTSNYMTTAGDFVAGSLQGAVTEEGMLEAPSNMTGGMLEYPLNSLTDAGGGKTGPDSGLAYEWIQLTEDKVWVVNTAYGATDIVQWVPGGNCYNRSVPVWNDVLETYQAEIDAGHYTEGSKLVFWQQGEMGDATNPAAEYEAYFDTMYQAMTEELGMDAFGFIMVRAGYATNRGADYRSEKDLKMSESRIAQYWLGSGISPYANVFVASNENEHWISDANVKSYFEDRYGMTLSYPTQSGTGSVPTTVNEVHYDIHYSQIAHNENGITAAEGIYDVLTGSSAPASVSWRDEDGQTVSSITLELSTDTAIAVPVVEPAYTAKQLTGISVSGNVITYDAAAGVVQGASEAVAGTGRLVASAGRTTGMLSVTVSVPVDLSGVAGPNYTGLYLYDGVWWYLEKGIVQTDYEGVVQNGDEWWYVKNGRADFTYTDFVEVSDGWWYMEDGRITRETTSVIKDTNKRIAAEAYWWYVADSKVDFSYTGFGENENGRWYIEDGKVTFEKNGILQDTTGAIGEAGTWYNVSGSKVQSAYTGFLEDENGCWYVEDGIVTFETNSVIKDTTGAIGEAGTWYYVVGSKVQSDFTGLANYKNNNGWWYIENGVVDFNYEGFAENQNGQWYIEGGKVTFTKQDILKDTPGALGEKGAWYYVIGSKVQTSFTGLGNFRNSHGWWYIENGKVDFNHNGVDKNTNGWWYIENGKVDFNYEGFAENQNGQWYIEGGKVTFTKQDILKDTPGALGEKGAWYYVIGSKVQTSFTGLSNFRNSHGWWYIESGKVDFNHNGVDKNINGWWYVTGGKVDFGYTGIGNNQNGWWYIRDGKVDFDFTGSVTVDGVTYSVSGGKVNR